MKTYLVTGAAGFIGANYLKYILAKHDDIRVVVLDALTYAGNLGTIASDIDNERCFFVKGKKLFRIKNIKNLLLSKNIRNFVNDKASNPISNHEKSNLCRISSRCWSMKEITIIKQ